MRNGAIFYPQKVCAGWWSERSWKLHIVSLQQQKEKGVGGGEGALSWLIQVPANSTTCNILF